MNNAMNSSVLFNARQEWLAAKREAERKWAVYVVAVLQAEKELKYTSKLRRLSKGPAFLKVQGE